MEYRRDIDGLRSVAVGLVIAYHAFPDHMTGGFVGVDIFFVISGFLITTIIVSDMDGGKFSISAFYLRRARRILPALSVVLISTLVLGWIFLLPTEIILLGKHVFASSIFSSNFILWMESGYFDASANTKPLLHLWSLGIEEQFYLIWPLIISFIPHKIYGKYLLTLSITIASLAYSINLVSSDGTAAFYSPLSRAWELSTGGLAALFVMNLRLKPSPLCCDAMVAAGLLMIGYSAHNLSAATPFPGLAAMLPVVGTVFVLLVGDMGCIGRYALGNPLMVAAGLISYPLYLWHWPLIAYAHILIPTGPSYALMAALVVSSFVLSAATYLFIERPVRLRALWKRRCPWIVGPAMALIGITGLLFYTSDGAVFRYPAGVREVLTTGTYVPTHEARYPTCWLPGSAPIGVVNPECGFSGAGKPRAVVWGDSHAAIFYAGLKTQSHGLDIAQYTRSSCPPLLGFPGDCGASNAEILKKIEREQPEVLILVAAWANYTGVNPNFDQSADFRKTLEAVKSTGIRRVIVLGPTPYWIPDLPILVFREWSISGELPDRISYGSTDLVRKWDQDMEKSSGEANVEYLSVHRIFCDLSGCLTHIPTSRSSIIAFDKSHLTLAGSAFVASELHKTGWLTSIASK